MTKPTGKRLICKNDDGTSFIVYRYEDNADGVTFSGVVVESTDPTTLRGLVAENWFLGDFEDYNGTVPVDGDNPDD